MPNLRDALNQIAADEAKNSVVATVRNLVSKSADAARQRGGGMMTAPEQLTSNGMLSNLKMQVKLTSSGDTLTLAPVDNGMFPVYGDAGVGWVNCFIKSNVTLSTVGKTSGKLYDVFGYWDQTLNPPNGALELVEWTNETTRSVALLTQDGTSLKSTDTSRRFISVVRYNGSTMLVPSIDPNGELFFGTGDPRNNTSDPFSGVGMSAGGVTFDGFAWQFFAALLGKVGVGFNSSGQLVWGSGAVFADINGLLFNRSGAFLVFKNQTTGTYTIAALQSMGEFGFQIASMLVYSTPTVTNGGFESGSLTGWATVAGSPAASTTQKHTGSYSAAMPSGAEIRQSSFTAVSSTYGMIELWGYFSSTYGANLQCEIECYTAGSALISTANLNMNLTPSDGESAGWRRAFFVGKYPAATAKIKIKISNVGSETCYIDDVLFMDGVGYVQTSDGIYGDVTTETVSTGTLTAGDTLVQTLEVTSTSNFGGAIDAAGGIDLLNTEVRSGTVTLADDTATSFTPLKVAGMIVFGTTGTGWGGTVFYNTATPSTGAVSIGANTTVTTGVLSGTTGTDVRINISAHTDGKIYIENRSGGSRAIFWTLM